MITVENLTKNYGPFQALKGVSFSIDKGEVVGFLGPNGAGKTTTMRILTCFMPASSGKATVAGYDVFKESLAVRQHIGYLPENIPLYPEMTVMGYLKFISKIKGLPRSKRAQRMEIAIESCGLTERRDQIIGQLSKGYRQRVGLAQALIHDPDVIILDEPTAGLDPRQIIEIRQLIRELGKEHTIILSTHILPEASMTCERLIVINEGWITGEVRLSEGRAISINTGDGLRTELSDMKTLYLEVSGPADEVRTALERLPNVAQVESQGLSVNDNLTFHISYDVNADIRAQVSANIIQNGWGLLEMRSVEMTLEEIFLQLTTSMESETQGEGEESSEA
ncbi:MAG: ATP-binding cassette domain-containing protein [Candidatus Poribacteria bacterium]|nr:ATP-binding cassette domain-containing protein [Candidatus Poribacteria bacterium]